MDFDLDDYMVDTGPLTVAINPAKRSFAEEFKHLQPQAEEFVRESRRRVNEQEAEIKQQFNDSGAWELFGES